MKPIMGEEWTKLREKIGDLEREVWLRMTAHHQVHDVEPPPLSVQARRAFAQGVLDLFERVEALEDALRCAEDDVAKLRQEAVDLKTANAVLDELASPEAHLR